MAVTATLALAPMIRENIIDTKHIIVDSKIGSSGAGAGSGTSHAMRAGVIRPYKPSGHRHTGEIEQELGEIAGEKNRRFNEPACAVEPCSSFSEPIFIHNHTFSIDKKTYKRKSKFDIKIYCQHPGHEYTSLLFYYLLMDSN